MKKSKLQKADKKENQKSKFGDEFAKYLKNQTNNTTVNGQEIKPFAWYKKILGLIK